MLPSAADDDGEVPYSAKADTHAPDALEVALQRMALESDDEAEDDSSVDQNPDERVRRLLVRRDSLTLSPAAGSADGTTCTAVGQQSRGTSHTTISWLRFCFTA